MMTVEIDGLRLYARHGVLEQERTVGNLFEVSLSLQCASDEAGRDDDLSTTINYAEVIDTVRRIMEEPVKLLECVAWRIRDAVSRRWPEVTGGCIKVSKLTPPCGVSLHHVGVILTW